MTWSHFSKEKGDLKIKVVNYYYYYYYITTTKF